MTKHQISSYERVLARHTSSPATATAIVRIRACSKNLRCASPPVPWMVRLASSGGRSSVA